MSYKVRQLDHCHLAGNSNTQEIEPFDPKLTYIAFHEV